MILRILILTCAVLVSPSLGGLSLFEFNENFEDMCFQENLNDEYLINGQETPLSNTIENFIAMAEKLELANPMISLKEELFYFIRNYIFENIQLSTDSSGQVNVGPWKPGSSDMSEIKKLLDPNGDPNRVQQLNDPFSDPEKCSLYYMISHSIVDKPQDLRAMRSFDNNSSNRVFRSELNYEDYYPQEIGVVAIRGTDVAVSLSRVLVGLYVGLNPDRKKDLTSFERIPESVYGKLPTQQERIVDPLYTLTMAEVLMLSKWSLSNRQGLAGNGDWESTSFGKTDVFSNNGKIGGFCPMVYMQSGSDSKILNSPAYSYSSVRGAADGLILGMAVPSIENKKQTVRLSQLLRMYYSRDGISVNGIAEQMNGLIRTSRVSFCNRGQTMENLEETLAQQMKLYGYLVSEKFSDVNSSFTNAMNLYTTSKVDIYQNSNTEIASYCNKAVSIERPEDLPINTFLDVFVLMDSRISETAFQTQQMITGYLAKYLDLRYSGSRMTILLDQKVQSTSSTSHKIELKPVVVDTYSSSCAACTVGQIVYEQSTIDRDQVILAIDQLLEEKKENEAKYNGANGKVVIYFNFENDVKTNNKIQGGLEKTLRDFHYHHQDVILYAVGLYTDVLKQFTRSDPNLVFVSADGNEEDVAKKLYEKLSEAPALLQYEDCYDGRSESSALYENFVSPLTLQHWVMPAKYFYKSTSLQVMFDSTNGPITVCHNRATMKPENEAKFCKNNSISKPIEFKLSNPCKSLTKDTCAPFYFAVIGGNGNGNGNGNGIADRDKPRDLCNDVTDHWCNTLDDIKFKVTHNGIRCNGCLGLGAAPVVILLTILLSYLLHKRF